MFSNVEDTIPLVKVHRNGISLGIVAILLAFVIVKLVKRWTSKYPPGPMGLPIVGYMPFLSENMFPEMAELAKKYGDVVSLNFGTHRYVVLNGAEVMREAFNKPEFLGRPPESEFTNLNPNSIFFANRYHAWKIQRKFVVQSLKDLGLGKTKMEQDVTDEVHYFIEVLKSQNGKPIDVKEPLSPSISNTICALIFGKRYEHDHPDRQLLDKSLEAILDNGSNSSLNILFPWLRKVPFSEKFLTNKHLTNAVKTCMEIFQKKVNEHKETFDSADLRDFIDKYLVEIDSEKEKNPDSTFSEDMLLSNVLDLFNTGSETIRSSIDWSVYTMATYPDIQEKVRRELINVIGTEKEPEYTDLKKLPYTHAVILEVMRWKGVAPLIVDHYTMADTTVGGYDIPKGTTVLANLYNVHHDPKFFDEPHRFKPERFLSKDGKAVVKSKTFMPFSTGKRICPGESMAYLEIFLYFTSMLQKFKIVFPEGKKQTFNAKLMFTYRLEPYLVQFLPRD